MTSSNGNIFRVSGHFCEVLNSPHKGQWRGALMISLICVWVNGWVNNHEAGDLRRHRTHYDVIVLGKRWLSLKGPVSRTSVAVLLLDWVSIWSINRMAFWIKRCQKLPIRYRVFPLKKNITLHRLQKFTRDWVISNPLVPLLVVNSYPHGDNFR